MACVFADGLGPAAHASKGRLASRHQEPEPVARRQQADQNCRPWDSYSKDAHSVAFHAISTHGLNSSLHARPSHLTGLLPHLAELANAMYTDLVTVQSLVKQHATCRWFPAQKGLPRPLWAPHTTCLQSFVMASLITRSRTSGP